MRNWLARNAANGILLLAIVGGLYFGLFKGKSFAEGRDIAINIISVVIGIGFLIFIHELGHFLAAKACNVNVETFSIGFGPPIPGCHFRYGETQYKLALFPIGGFVKMPGEYPSEQVEKSIAEDPRSFMNKPVWQRMIIISAGVIMNILFGMLFFIYVYFAGKMEMAPRLGAVESGSPAALAGLQAGSEILQIETNPKPSFEDLFYYTALSRPGVTELDFKWRTPDRFDANGQVIPGEEREGKIIPRKDGNDQKPMIGVGRPDSLVVVKASKSGQPLGRPGSPAALAGFQGNDRLLGVRAVGDAEFRPLHKGWGYSQAEYDFRGKTIELQVQREGGTVVLKLEPRYFHSFGLRMQIGPITGIRDKKYVPSSAQAFEVGDVIVSVDGDKSFDPMQLPDRVMDLVRDKAGKGQPIEVVVKRGAEEVRIKLDPTELQGCGTWNEERPMDLNSPVSIPALGICYQVQPTVVSVAKDFVTEQGGIRPGDTIVRLNAYDPSENKRRLLSMDEAGWPGVFTRLQFSQDKLIEFTVRDAAGQERDVTLTAVEDKQWPYPDRGVLLQTDTQIVTASSIGEAIALGFRYNFRFIGRIYMTLKGLVTRDISPKLLSGPFEMVKATYSMAELGFNQLILFLGVISINLAVVNFLPIPILDGGHMVFLIVEKLRRKRVSERTLIIANSIGLAFIACLMLFVIFLDVSKMEFFRKLF